MYGIRVVYLERWHYLPRVTYEWAYLITDGQHGRRESAHSSRNHNQTELMNSKMYRSNERKNNCDFRFQFVRWLAYGIGPRIRIKTQKMCYQNQSYWHGAAADVLHFINTLYWMFTGRTGMRSAFEHLVCAARRNRSQTIISEFYCFSSISFKLGRLHGNISRTLWLLERKNLRISISHME